MVNLGRVVFGLAILSAAWVSAPPAQAAAPRVVASIKPIQSLIAGVMQGIGEPFLIVQGAASPHTYVLRPSDARHLENAQLVFWIGPTMEGFLPKALTSLSTKGEIIELDRLADMKLLNAREGGVWEPDGDEPPHDAPVHDASALEKDGHIWLDPDNAKAIVRSAMVRLSVIDPPNAARYIANGEALARRIEILDGDLRKELTPLQGKPFIVFHDAYQYFETRYRLTAVGSITVSPDRMPGARRIARIRDKLQQSGARCIFAEPQFQPALMENLIEGTEAQMGVLDPEGTSLPPGPELYFTLMHDIGHALAACLG